MSFLSRARGLTRWWLGFGFAFLVLSMTTAVIAEEDPATATWDAMSDAEKLEVLKDSALELDEDGAVASGGLFNDTNTLWTCLAAFLVFFIQAGFAMV